MRKGLHQTPFSRLIKGLPLVGAVARKAWALHQRRAFWRAIRVLSEPAHSRPSGEVPMVPEIAELVDQDSRVRGLGEAFSREMTSVTSTSKFGSMGYEMAYGPCLAHLRSCSVRVLEFGIGVADPKAPSGMPQGHRQGASLVGWAKYFPKGEIHGADVDERTLVDTDQYKTHFVDQLVPSTLKDLAESLAGALDLVVDDGLHTAEANGNTLSVFLPLLSPRGVYVVEDILPEYEGLWLQLEQRLMAPYAMRFFRAETVGFASSVAVLWRRSA